MERWQEPNRWGSSPLTRGKLWASTRDERASRLIPAHAGKTPTRSGRSGRWAAHPRSRGENTTLTTAALIGIGSSPLTRGKPSTPPVMWYTERLIPAHAGKTTVRQTGRRRFRAHPRSRGENDDIDDAGRPTRGSSPLTRGKRLRARCDQLRSRLIPAHAGKTLPRGQFRACQSAHPRSRGENASSCKNRAKTLGSSPLTRGKLLNLLALHAERRLIPAHAGKTLSWLPSETNTTAHPRSRGENHHSQRASGGGWGSSPLTRGKLQAVLNLLDDAGLIPAHAGKTAGPRAVWQVAGAHPRSRGENIITFNDLPRAQGSSPLTRGKLVRTGHVRPSTGLIPAHAGKTHTRAHPRYRVIGSSPLTRGKHNFSGCEVCGDGLIPAHAGKTARPTSSGSLPGAHPRSRGENDATDKFKNTLSGSSPLTRGKRRQSAAQQPPSGLIPAHAGKTKRGDRGHGNERAHPRSRGENLIRPADAGVDAGSSPLTRGKHLLIEAHGHLRRLIPAHAGKTSMYRQLAQNLWAHPRSRGENPWKASRAYSRVGSSPLTRGKHAMDQTRGEVLGLIPAHAGKTP